MARIENTDNRSDRPERDVPQEKAILGGEDGFYGKRTSHPPLVLASGSPRRRELMALLTPHFLVEPADIDETIPPDEPLDKAVVRLASEKAAAAQQKQPRAICIGADTVVELDGIRFGKPRDRQHAWEMLCQLNARTHTVLTGLSVLAPDGHQESCCVRTLVQFRACSPEELTAYLDTGEPMDKAGAYGIQGYGAKFILGIQGDYYSVIGLPVARLCQLLSRLSRSAGGSLPSNQMNNRQ